MKLALTLSVTLLGASIVVLMLLTTAFRLVRLAVEHRQRLLRDVLRKSLMPLLSGDAELEEFSDLISLRSNQLEQVSEALLTKIRGDSRDALVELLEKRGAIEYSIRRTSHRGSVTRCSAATFLGNTGVKRAREPLEKLLSDQNREVRITAARALGRLSNPDAVPRLLASLDSRRRSVPFGAVIAALVRIGPSGTPYLVSSLNASGKRERAAAAELVGLLGVIEAVPILSEHLAGDPELDVQIRCARALGRIGSPRAIDPLLSAITPANPLPLRVVSCAALGQIGGTKVLQELVHLVDDCEAPISLAAAKALSRQGAKGLATLSSIVANHKPGEIYAKEFIARQRVKRPRQSDDQQIASQIRVSE